MASILDDWRRELEGMREKARAIRRALTMQVTVPLRRRGLVAAELRRIETAARVAAALIGHPGNSKPLPVLEAPDEAVRGCGRIRLLDSSGFEIGTVHDLAMLEGLTDERVFSAVKRGRKVNGILYLLRKPHLAARDAEGNETVTDAPSAPPGQAVGDGSGALPADSDGIQTEVNDPSTMG